MKKSFLILLLVLLAVCYGFAANTTVVADAAIETNYTIAGEFGIDGNFGLAFVRKTNDSSMFAFGWNLYGYTNLDDLSNPVFEFKQVDVVQKYDRTINQETGEYLAAYTKLSFASLYDYEDLKVRLEGGAEYYLPLSCTNFFMSGIIDYTLKDNISTSFNPAVYVQSVKTGVIASADVAMNMSAAGVHFHDAFSYYFPVVAPFKSSSETFAFNHATTLSWAYDYTLEEDNDLPSFCKYYYDYSFSLYTIENAKKTTSFDLSFDYFVAAKIYDESSFHAEDFFAYFAKGKIGLKATLTSLNEKNKETAVLFAQTTYDFNADTFMFKVGFDLISGLKGLSLADYAKTAAAL